MKNYTIPAPKRLAELNMLSGIQHEEFGTAPTSYELVFGHTFNAQGARPQRRGIAIIRLDTPRSRVVYRRFRGVAHADESEVVITQQTLAEIIGKNGKNASGLDVIVEPANGWKDRYNFYWCHPIDSFRVAFRMGILGFIFTILTTLFSVFIA